MSKHKWFWTLCSLALILTMIPMESFAASLSQNYDELQRTQKINENEQFMKENLSSIWEQCEEGTIPATVETAYMEGADGTKIPFQVYSYRESVYSDDQSVVYADNKVWEVPLAQAGISENTRPHADDPLYGSTTLYYELFQEGYARYFRVVKGSGNYSITDSAFSVIDQHVFIKQFGAGSPTMVSEVFEANPTGTSWAYNTGFTGKVLDTGDMMLQIKWTFTVKRQSTFTCEFDHQY